MIQLARFFVMGGTGLAFGIVVTNGPTWQRIALGVLDVALWLVAVILFNLLADLEAERRERRMRP